MENLVVVKRAGLTVMNSSNPEYMAKLLSGRNIYRAVSKCQAGFLCTSEVEANSPIEAFRRYKSKSLQSLEFVTESGSTITMYARVGNKVWASDMLLIDMEVRDINQDLGKTALYSQAQYEVVNAKNWACKAFRVNVIN
jgi:molybdopterin/thiamine biosynthesis adenylyltransferase